ncbi:MAG: SMC family ATPase [Chloroflexota bacterium]
MIPIRIRITGFLSYKQAVEVDFSTFELACISGANGAGKSSLLDAITWVLFGQARKRDDSLIHNHPDVKAAEVIFDFQYEDQIYRIQRTLPRNKSTMLELQIRAAPEPDGEVIWRSLSEHNIRETQARIVQILRLDYDTFINAAFFLQGKADQFAQQPSGKRKEILGNILGLELWETFRYRANERRKVVERDLASKDGQLQEIELELSEESVRKSRLKELEEQLEGMITSRKLQESTLEKLRQLINSLKQQHILVDTLNAGVMRTISKSDAHNARLAERIIEKERFVSLLERAIEIEQAYTHWKSVQKDLENWEAVAERFREHEKERQPLLNQLSSEQARLEQEMKTLLTEQENIKTQEEALPELEKEQLRLHTSILGVDKKLKERDQMNEAIKLAREKQIEMRSENDRLKSEMSELKDRIENLEATEGAICPLCGQSLSPEDRVILIDQLNNQGTALGDRFRANKSGWDEITLQVTNMENELTNLLPAEKERLLQTTQLTQLEDRTRTYQENLSEWKDNKAGRFITVKQLLEKENFLPETRNELAELDKKLGNLGYDAVAHDAAKRAEIKGRESEVEYHSLSSAKAAIKPLEDEINNLHKQIDDLAVEIEKQKEELKQATDALTDAEKMKPDMIGAERALFDIQEQENRLNQDVGAARQKVSVLKDLRSRRKRLDGEREDLAGLIGRLKTLERAFGKDGVPALLIEQALPEIESRANDLLDRLSDGSMSVRFVTQSSYKDKKRDDLKETLDIQISDGVGVRDYEMFSGGEAFRVNFAIRLALSEVLSHRKGARLQTLVIDEGFGSQDAHGRQRLIESINAVRGDFAKVLVITHLDELKDAFQTRIDVTKTENGSVVSVI